MILGIDIGGTGVKFGVIADDYTIVKSCSIPTLSQRPVEEIVNDIIAKAKDASTTALDWGVFIVANGTTAQLVVDGETVSQQVFDSAVDILSDRLYHHLAVSYDAATKELALWIFYFDAISYLFTIFTLK